MNDDDGPLAMPSAHRIGQELDALSLGDFDDRLAILRAEIARLEAARARKRAALAEAGAIFGSRP